MYTYKVAYLIGFFTLLYHHQIYGQKAIYDSLNALKEYAYLQPQKTIDLAHWLLQTADKNNNIPLKQAVLFHVANHYYFTIQYTKADSLYEEVIKLGKNTSKDTLSNLCKVRKVYVLQSLDKWEEAYQMLHKQLIEIQQVKDTTAWISVLNALGLQHEHHYLQDSALFYYKKALKLAEKSNDEYQYAYLLNNIGLLKYQGQHHSQAEQDFKESYQKAIKIKHIRLQLHALNNLGITYIAQRKLDSAIFYLEIFAKTSKKYNYIRETGIAYHNLARCYQEKGQYNEALRCFDSSAALIKLLPEKIYSIRPFNGYASVYQTMGRHKEAILYAEKALKLCENTNYIEDLILAHQTLALSHEALKNYEKALHHYKEFKRFSDSLQTLNRQKLIAEYQAQYQVEKKEKEIQKLEKQRQVQRFKNHVALLSISFLAILLVISIYVYYSRQKRKSKEQYAQKLTLSIEEERSRIAKELHDEVGQILSAVKNKIHLYSKENSQLNDTESQLSDAIEQIRTIAQTLYPPYLRKVNFEKAIETLLQRIKENSQLFYTLEITVENLETWLSENSKLHLYRIIQECLNNTLKHAEANAVKITIEQKQDKLYLVYQDNGKGIQQKSQLNGMGMLSIQERVRILKGNMELKNTEKGIKLQFTFQKEHLCL